MVAPVIGNIQIPNQIRLFASIGVTLSIMPFLIKEYNTKYDNIIYIIHIISCEILIGIFIGTLAKLFFSSFEFFAIASANLLGLANPFGIQFDQSQTLPPIATFIVMSATIILFENNFHLQIIIAIIDSYKLIPLGSELNTNYSLKQIINTIDQSFIISIRTASPFFLYSIIVNFAMALINRVTPQIAIFFIAPSFIVTGGILIIYYTIRGQISEFSSAFSNWIDTI